MLNMFFLFFLLSTSQKLLCGFEVKVIDKEIFHIMDKARSGELAITAMCSVIQTVNSSRAVLNTLT